MLRIITVVFLCLGLNFASAQQLSLEHEDVSTWKEIDNTRISDDGRWVTYQLTPIEGDPSLHIYDGQTGKSVSFERASGARLSVDGRYAVFTIEAPADSVRALRRQKVKDDDLPKDTLAIYNLATGDLEKIPSVKSFQLPDKWSGWLAYHLEPTGDVNGKKENGKNGSVLMIRSLDGAESLEVPFARQYTHAEEGERFLIESTGNDSTFLPGVYLFEPGMTALQPIFRSKGTYKYLSFDEPGRQIAFLANLDTTEAQIPPFQVFYWTDGRDTVLNVADGKSDFLPDGWIISEHARPNFSEDGGKLYFGYAPEPILPDTSLLEDEVVNVEVWHYEDSRLHTQQKVRLNQDKNKSYACVWHIGENEVIRLGSEALPDTRLGNEGNARYVLATNEEPYLKQTSWEGYPICMELALVDNETGETSMIAEKVCGNPNLSPEAQFVYWYSSPDTAWFAYDIGAGRLWQITDNQITPFYDTEDDHPDYPPSHGSAGWLAGDAAMLVYDRYDIWRVDPQGKNPPVRLTEGRADKISYRYLRLDREARFIDPEKRMLLYVFNEENKHSGYAWLDLKTGKTEHVAVGAYSVSTRPLKAKDAEKYVYTKESFRMFPDLLYGDDLEDGRKISDANSQQADFAWGDVELYKWTSLDGQQLQGLLVKPDDFDPNKKYPLIVNFYERSSDGLYRHRAPGFGRHTINYAFYVSRGYVIFNPDVPYRIGYPGESAFNAVVSGVSNLVKEGFVDKERMALQGHSWGGYQIAYLLTKTDMFACAESGAPVVNMISAYGGIRWGSGLSRMFQYEHKQSRIGGSLWEYPLRYIENSPIFTLDKINTPVLILHNDADGAVPWYQGIEFFVGMRRLGKPAWMLNYNDEPHWPVKLQNRKDFNRRLQQFFDHYLQDAPMPQWMERGVPALEKGIRQGYELLEGN